MGEETNIWRQRRASATLTQRGSMKENEGLRVQQLFSDYNECVDTSPNKPFGVKENKRLPSIKNNNKLSGNSGNTLKSFNSVKLQTTNDPLVTKPTTVDSNKSPVYTPQKAIDLFTNILTDFEKKEILLFSEIYYVGEKKDSKKLLDTNTFTDNSGMYKHTPHDHLAYRYEVISFLGKGSFGQVLKTHDYKLKKDTAVKMIKKGQKYYKQAKVEVSILHTLGQQDGKGRHNIVSMYNYFTFRGHVCISFELLSINLYDLLKRNKFKGMEQTVVRRFARSILSCLDLLYRNKLIHCDLKPENVLLRGPFTNEIKVIDFGSSCYENQRVYSYIQSRFYRSPEVILGAKYGTPIDMWSLGCVLCELYTGKPLFAGENEGDQMARIMEMVGDIPFTMTPSCRRIDVFMGPGGVPKYCTVEAEGGHRKLKGSKSPKGVYRGPPGTKSLASALNTYEQPFVDFLKRCLCLNPHERINPIQASKHPWLNPVKPASRADHRRDMIKSFSTNKLKSLPSKTEVEGKVKGEVSSGFTKDNGAGKSNKTSAKTSKASNVASKSGSEVNNDYTSFGSKNIVFPINTRLINFKQL